MWTKIEKYDKMDTKGPRVSAVITALLVREVIQTSLDKIIMSQDVRCIDYVKSPISGASRIK
jgi:DNA polymerase delta subunit 1